MTKYISYISEIAAHYDAFILDLWGVIHDGQQLYPKVKECLMELRARDKNILFLSNAPRRAAAAEEALYRMGIPGDLYDGIITSGETAYQCLARPAGTCFTPSGKRYVYIGLEKDRHMLDGLEYEETRDAASARFVLLSHSFYDNQPLEELVTLLNACLEANLPLLCINPDLEVVRMGGERVYCAGVIAARYHAMGGEVIYFGKPYTSVYEACMQQLAGLEKSRILAVGDSLKTDIRGANMNGFDCVLVTGGVLKETVGEPGNGNYEEKLHKISALEGIYPEYAVAAFNW